MSRQRRQSCPQAIDRTPLSGPDRPAYERILFNNPQIKKTVRLVLRELLAQWFWGRADCYPSAPAIAERTGYSIPTVKRALAYLEKIGVIVRVIDRSILPAQRRIILSSHPNAAAILVELRGNPYVEFVGDRSKGPPRQKRLPLVGVGVSKTLDVGVSKTPPSRVRVPVAVETRDFEPVAERVEKSPPLNGNGCPLETGSQAHAQPAAQARAIAPASTEQAVNAALMATLTASVAIAQATRHQATPPAPCIQAIDGWQLTPLQAELVAMFTPEMRSQFDQAPAEIRAEILRTFRSGIISPAAFDMVRIKLANLGAFTPATEILGAVLGSPAAARAPAAMPAPLPEPSLVHGPALFEALASINHGTTREEVQSIAWHLTGLLNDRGSLRYWIGVLRDVRQGKLSPGFVAASIKATCKDPAVDRPAAAAAARIQKERQAREGRLRGRPSP